MWKIKLFLEGGLTHELGDVRIKPGWGDCQASRIERVEFPFTAKEGNFRLILAGMEKYNFFVEAMKNVMGGKSTIKGLWFMGQIPGTNQVTGFVIKDTIFKLNSVKGKEYSGTVTSGWKAGFIGNPIISRIVKE